MLIKDRVMPLIRKMYYPELLPPIKNTAIKMKDIYFTVEDEHVLFCKDRFTKTADHLCQAD
jgi:hypothetical protein